MSTGSFGTVASPQCSTEGWSLQLFASAESACRPMARAWGAPCHSHTCQLWVSRRPFSSAQALTLTFLLSYLHLLPNICLKSFKGTEGQGCSLAENIRKIPPSLSQSLGASKGTISKLDLLTLSSTHYDSTQFSLLLLLFPSGKECLWMPPKPKAACTPPVAQGRHGQSPLSFWVVELQSFVNKCKHPSYMLGDWIFEVKGKKYCQG